MTGPVISPRALDRRVIGRHALLDVAIDIFDDDDRIIDHEADRQHQGQKRQQIDRIAEQEQKAHDAHHGERNRHDRDDRRAQVAEEEKDHHDDDERGLGNGLFDFADRGADEIRRVIGDRAFEPDRQLRLDFRKGLAHGGDDIERIGRRRRIDADENRFQPVEDRG